MKRAFALLFVFLFLSGVPVAMAQSDTDSTIAKANRLYSSGSFSEAYNLLVQLAPETADAKVKTAASDCLVEIGQAEYSARNFRNAFDSFKTALKMRATNQVATQMYLKMKKEMDVNNLTNATPKPPAAAPVLAVAPIPVAPSYSPQRVEEGARSKDAELKKLQTQLKAAQSQLSTATGSSDHMDPASLQQIVSLLSDIATRMSESQSRMTVEQDPKIISLLENMGKMLDRSSVPAFSPVVVLICSILIFLLLSVIVFIVVLRAKRLSTARILTGNDGAQRIVGQNTGDLRITSSSLARLSEYSPEVQGAAMNSDSAAAKAAGLLKMERLQVMYNDLNAGVLRWETIAANLDVLESSLKAEILNLVEKKLDAGDVVSYEAVLPVIFPFLTDYDDFFRQKADNLARAALVSSANEMMEAVPGPFEMKAALRIPELLKKHLNGADRSLVTAKLSRAVAKRMGLSSKEVDEVFRGALLHDAGYLRLDINRMQRIISKKEMSSEDMIYVRSHVSNGVSYFDVEAVPDFVRNALLYHHERIDGSGYPEGLAGDAIPVIARIIGASETFVALCSKKSYRDKFDTVQAIAILRDGRGTKFDTTVVDAIVAIGLQLEASV